VFIKYDAQSLTNKIIMRELKLPQFNNIDELLDGKFGCCSNVFFGENSDWSKVLFFFNGAITQKKLDLDVDSAIFQRWSWYDKFRHPVFCIADPLACGKNGIPLAWYQGDTNEIYLKKIISSIKKKLNEKVQDFESVAIGSSGGGFAALLSAQLGLVDSVIAINPQTDIRKFYEKNAVNAFLKCRRELGLEFETDNYSLLDTGFSLVKKSCQITYLQNTCDESHYFEHMMPYIESVLKHKVMESLNLQCFTDPLMGHNPPPLHAISRIAGSAFNRLLK
jgi:hypothetical protein